MYNNKIQATKIIQVSISINEDTTYIIYYIRLFGTKYNMKDFKVFKIKQELINYLNDE